MFKVPEGGALGIYIDSMLFVVFVLSSKHLTCHVTIYFH